MQQYYDKYFEEINYKGATGVLMNFIWKFMEKPHKKRHYNKVLEIGSTHLEHLQYVRHDYKTYIASDICDYPSHASAISIMKNLSKNKEVKKDIADAHSLKYKSNTFDRVLVTCLMHHLSYPEKAFSEMLRVTKKGGQISIFLPNDPGILYRLIRYWTTHKRSRNLEKQDKIENHKYLWATEHRNHILGLTVMVREIYKNQVINVRRFPPYIKPWNLGFFSIYEITKVTNLKDDNVVNSIRHNKLRIK
jgi:phosphatidylethanolamine/phosphatidyl-N-methylethanolamine N-methyltransferase